MGTTDRAAARRAGPAPAAPVGEWSTACAHCPHGRFWLALGNTSIFLVLALLTPPVTTCLYPCIPAVYPQAVPLIMAFGVSSLLAVVKAISRKHHNSQVAAAAAPAAQQQREGEAPGLQQPLLPQPGQLEAPAAVEADRANGGGPEDV